ncbi:MAG: GIY-YIG nuclease family protein [Salibacteraceae bacterium]|nr:GIY-YIG nuclease family protein [Salibacteraceae bacterium]
MNLFVVYTLKSNLNDKRYIGFTSNLINRFHSHNTFGTKGWTINSRLWRVIYVEFFESKQEAMKRKQFLKSGQGRAWLKLNVKDY